MPARSDRDPPVLLGAPESVGSAAAAGTLNARSLADVDAGTMASICDAGAGAADDSRAAAPGSIAVTAGGRVGGDAVLERSSLADLRRTDVRANSSAAAAFLFAALAFFSYLRDSIHSSHACCSSGWR